MKITPLCCPNCGATLQVKTSLHAGSTAHCEHCGNDFILEQEYVAPPRSQYQAEAHKQPFNQHQAANHVASRKFAAVFVVLALVIMTASIGLPMMNMFNRPMPEPEWQAVPAARATPVSAPINSFLAVVFGKTANDITPEEIASIKYLDITIADYFTPGSYEPWRSDRDDVWTFTYSLADYYAFLPDFEGTLETVFVPKASGDAIEWEDMQCFTGLTWLETNRCSDINGTGRGVSLEGLTGLKHFGSGFNQDVYEMARLLADPAQIRSLTIGLRHQRDVEALVLFTNLEALSLSYIFDEDIDNINQISALKTLKTLTVNSGDDISWLSVLPSVTSLTLNSSSVTDYSVLYGMPALEELNLTYALDLRDIGFVRSMPKLRSLSIRHSEIISLEPLRDSISMQTLYIDASNNDLINIDALSTLTSLQTMLVDADDAECPSLSALTHLRTVALPANHIEAIAELTEITELHVLDNWPIGELDCAELSRFVNVKTLMISEVDTVKNFAALHELPLLTTLRIDDISLTNRKNFSDVFNLPYLETLELQSCSIAMDMATLKPSPSLQRLSIVGGYSWRFYDGETMVQEHSGAAPFAKVLGDMTSLRVLELPDAMLESISFVGALKELELLNISGNYVTDVAVLSELPELRVVFCLKNPIQNAAAISKSVRVYK